MKTFVQQRYAFRRRVIIFSTSVLSRTNTIFQNYFSHESKIVGFNTEAIEYVCKDKGNYDVEYHYLEFKLFKESKRSY